MVATTFPRRFARLSALAAAAFIAFTSHAHAAPRGTDRPIDGDCDTVVIPLSDPGSFPVILAIDVTCNLSHLGSTAGGTQREVIVPAGPANGTVLPIFISIERITYVAANGDELWSTFAGPGTIDFATGNAAFDGIETYIGGTGRFAHATGQSHTTGEGSLATNAGHLTVSGKISY